MFTVFLSLFIQAQAVEIPPTPPNPCYENCTPFMENLVADFNNIGVVPQFTPAVYSGDCYHLGQYDSNHTHHAVVMIDVVQNKPNFSTIFSFFAETNEFANWTLDISRSEMSPYWKDNGNIKIENGTARTEVLYEDGNPAYLYWMRQNPITDELLYITYAGSAMKSFCRLTKNN